MRYSLDAWLDNGVPRLQMRDEQGEVRLDWACRQSAEHDCHMRGEVQRLFKELFLLASGERLCGAAGPLAALAEACLRCDECATPTADAALRAPHAA